MIKIKMPQTHYKLKPIIIILSILFNNYFYDQGEV